MQCKLFGLPLNIRSTQITHIEIHVEISRYPIDQNASGKLFSRGQISLEFIRIYQ